MWRWFLIRRFHLKILVNILNVLIWINGKKKKLLTNLYPCFFQCTVEKERGWEEGGKDNCIGRNRQVVSFRLEGMESFSNKTLIFIMIFPLHVEECNLLWMLFSMNIQQLYYCNNWSTHKTEYSESCVRTAIYFPPNEKLFL